MSKSVYFDCDELIKACDNATNNNAQLSTVFSIDTVARQGNNGTKYLGLYATIGKKTGRLKIRIQKEKHVGRIAPLDDAEVSRLNILYNHKYGTIKKRDRNPTINIQKYKVMIETDERGVIKGNLPDESEKSPYFKVCEYLDKYFYDTISDLIANQKIIIKEDRRKEYPVGAIIVPNTKIISLYQTRVSLNSKINPDAVLINPISRITLKFDLDTGLPKPATFFDYTKRITNMQNNTVFEALLFDNEHVNAHNIHKLLSQSLISGFVNINAVCSSSMGISIPAHMDVMVVEPPMITNLGVLDVFDNMPLDFETDNKIQNTTNIVNKELNEDDLTDDLLEELDIGN